MSTLLVAFACSLITANPVMAGAPEILRNTTTAGCVYTRGGSIARCAAAEIDVTLSAAELMDGCEYIGDTATFIPSMTLSRLVSGARYDFRSVLALDGGNALVGACLSSILPESPSPYFDVDAEEGDVCGDVAGGQTIPAHPLPELTIPCVDTDLDGLVNMAGCFFWDQNIGRICTDLTLPDQLDTDKCHCTSFDITGLSVPTRTVEVRKQLGLLAPPGQFDLAINGMTHASAVGDGGTTGPVEITNGLSTVAVSESASGQTQLAEYASSIECLDMVGRCSLNTGLRCVTDSRCQGVSAGTCNLTPTPVASCTDCTSQEFSLPMEQVTVVCTIVNRRIELFLDGFEDQLFP